LATAAFVLDRLPDGIAVLRGHRERAFGLLIRARRFAQSRRETNVLRMAEARRRFLRSSATAQRVGSPVFLAARYAAGLRRGRNGVAACAVAVFLAISFRCSSVFKGGKAYPAAV